jgi:hypothetical protein
LAASARTFSHFSHSGSTIAPERTSRAATSCCFPRVVAAVDRPSQWRRIVLLIFEVQIRINDEPFREPILAKKRCPVQRGLAEKPTQIGSGAGFQ